MGALVYIAKRFGLYLAVLFIGLSITFLLPRLMPINPVDGYIGQIQSRANGALSAEAIAELRDNLENLYGLKGNLFTQYVDYMKRIVFSFDFGPSFTYFPQPVSQMLMAALPWTLSLLLTAKARQKTDILKSGLLLQSTKTNSLLTHTANCLAQLRVLHGNVAK